MLTDNTRKDLCRIVGLYDKKKNKKKKKKKKTIMSFVTNLCLIPENICGRLLKITGNGLAAGCQLFYRKIYGYFLQCVNNVLNTNSKTLIEENIFFYFGCGCVVGGEWEGRRDSNRKKKYVFFFSCSILNFMFLAQVVL